MNADAEVRGTILVVDDTPASVGMLQSTLEQENYEVLIATSGEKALNRVSLIIPDLILLDIMMPGIDGYETCLQLKSNTLTKNIPVIFLSALSETFDKVKAFSIGGVDYLTKPVEPEELLVRVKTHIRINQLEKQLQNSNIELDKKVKERTEELIRTNRALYNSEEFFRTLFNCSPIGTLFLNREGRILIANKAISDLLGVLEPELLQGIDLFNDPNFHTSFLHKIEQEKFVESEGLYDFSVIRSKKIYPTTKTGSFYYTITVSSLNILDNSEISGYIFLLQDITEKKRLERIIIKPEG